MGLRIRTNSSAIQAQRHLEGITKDVAQNMERLSSGKRINKAADDAAGLGVSEVLNAQSRSLVQAKRNASDSISMLQIAEGGMNEVSNILIRLRELAIQASSDTIGNRERSYANKEYNELISEIDRIGRISEFNGIKLLQGTDANENLQELSFHIGIGDGSTENTDTILLPLGPIEITAEGSLSLVKGPALGPIDGEDFGREVAAEQIDHIDFALNKINKMRSDLGARQSRLDSAIGSLAVSFENVSATRSRILDTDFAVEAASFTQNRILQEVNVQLLGQANMTPQLALSLLR